MHPILVKSNPQYFFLNLKEKHVKSFLVKKLEEFGYQFTHSQELNRYKVTPPKYEFYTFQQRLLFAISLFDPNFIRDETNSGIFNVERTDYLEGQINKKVTNTTSFVKGFEQFDCEKLTGDDLFLLFKFCLKAIPKILFIDSLNYLPVSRLSIEQRLNLFDRLKQYLCDNYFRHLKQVIHSLKFVQAIQETSSIEEKCQLLKQITDNSELLAKPIIEQFSIMGFEGAAAKLPDLSSKIAFYKKIASTSYWCCVAVAKMAYQLACPKNTKEIIDFLLYLVSFRELKSYPFIEEAIIKNYSIFQFDPKEHSSEILLLIAMHRNAYMVGNAHRYQIDLSRFTDDECRAFFKSILSNERRSAFDIVEAFFLLKGPTSESFRFEVHKALVSNFSLYYVAKFKNTIDRLNFTPEQTKELLESLLEKEIYADLSKVLHLLKLEKLDFQTALTLSKKCLQRVTCDKVFKNIKPIRSVFPCELRLALIYSFPSMNINYFQDIDSFGCIIDDATPEQKMDLAIFVLSNDQSKRNQEYAGYFLNQSSLFKNAPALKRKKLLDLCVEKMNDFWNVLSIFDPEYLKDFTLEEKIAILEKIARNNRSNNTLFNLLKFSIVCDISGASIRQILHLFLKIKLHGQDYDLLSYFYLMEDWQKFPIIYRQILFELSLKNDQFNKINEGILSNFPHVQYSRPLFQLLTFNLNEIPEAPIALKNCIDAIHIFIEENKQFHFIKKIIVTALKSEKTNNNNFIRLQIYKFAAYAMATLLEHPSDKITVIEKMGFIEAIMAYRTPKQRFHIMRELSNSSYENFYDIVNKPLIKLNTINQKRNTRSGKQNCALLSWILLSNLSPCEDVQSLTRQLYKSIYKRNIKEGKQVNCVITLLYDLKDNDLLENKDILEALIDIFDRKKECKKNLNIKEVILELKCLNSILNIFGKAEFLKIINIENRNYQQYFIDKFKTIFKLDSTESFTEKYSRTLAWFRNDQAIYIYMNSILRIGGKESEAVIKAFNLFINSVLNGTFHQIRYDVNLNPHLKKLCEHTLNLEDWKGSEPAKRIVNGGNQSKDVDYKKEFKKLMKDDGHLNLKRYSFLAAYFENQPYQEILQENYPHTDDTHFQLLTIQFMEKEFSMKQYLDQIEELYGKKVEHLSEELAEFSHNLKAFKEKLDQIADAQFEIIETDAPDDLLLLGTEIKGSCQRIDGFYNNIGLCGYILNGEVKPICIRRITDKTLVARAIMRLMWDKKNRTSVLLLERLYNNIDRNNEWFEKEILQWAKRKASKLNIPLVSREVREGESYGSKLYFGGGLSPYIYCDAASGVKMGAFTVDRCHILI